MPITDATTVYRIDAENAAGEHASATLDTNTLGRRIDRTAAVMALIGSVQTAKGKTWLHSFTVSDAG